MNRRDGAISGLFRFLLIAVPDWMNQRQLHAIDYLREDLGAWQKLPSDTRLD
jgi:hypothetical protein